MPLRRLAAVVCWALAAPALAWTAPPAASSIVMAAMTAPGEAPRFELTAPAGGAALVAGSTAELAWEPRAGFSSLAGATEWEAFLSVDGGASYPVRLTPHLDLDLRRCRWQVPHLATADARLLLRFGDERGETAFELPGRFVILEPSGAGAMAPALPALALHRGEPARPGDPGVAFWADGTRRGTAARQVAAIEQAALRPAIELPPVDPAVAEAAESETSNDPSAAFRPTSGPRLHGLWMDRPRAASAPARGRTSSDLLLLLRRRNE